MSDSRSFFDTLRRLSAREQRFVYGGAAIAAALLVMSYGILPFVDRWSEREALIQANAERAARLAALAAREDEFSAAIRALQASRDVSAGRLLDGSTQALAASRLQTLLARYAEQSRVSIGRIDLAGAADSVAPGIVAIPVQLSATGDVYGLVDFIAYIQGGEKLVVIDELGVRSNPEARDGTQVLSVTLRLRGLYAEEMSDPDSGEEAAP